MDGVAYLTDADYGPQYAHLPNIAGKRLAFL